MTTFFVLLFLPFGSAVTLGNNVWKEYSAEQKTQAIVGFVHCYRTALSNKEAFAQADITTAAHTIDVALAKNGDKNIGNFILEALKKAPSAMPERYAAFAAPRCPLKLFKLGSGLPGK